MNILISTTTHWNPGDDFIREGIFHLMPWLSKHNIEYIDRSPRVARKNLHRNLEWCDLYIHAGTPDWLAVHKPEYDHLMENDIPFALIGVGFPGGNHYVENTEWIIGVVTHPACKSFIVRDTYSAEFFGNLGIECQHLPCPAYYMFPDVPVQTNRNRIGIGFYAFDVPGQINHPRKSEYEEVLCKFERELSLHHDNFVIICHTYQDYDRARQLFTSRCFYSVRWQDYSSMYTSLRSYIGSRVHGAIAAASALTPAIHLAIDDRVSTCDGFPQIVNMSVDELDFMELIKIHNDLLNNKELPLKSIQHKRENFLRFTQLLKPLIQETMMEVRR